ncbi:MAG TPA: MFS transporter [Acidimicrobiales bacterium]|jgi:MFS family permease|nr:MFS transporter [Acidimicrobiales bacterium]
MNATFRSLGIRNFRLFFIGQAISQIGTWMRMVAMALLVLHITDSGVAVGLMTAFQFLPVLLLGAWAGLVADRSDKRKLLLIVQTALMGQSFALAALAFMDRPPVLALYAVALAGGVATAFDNPARRSFVVEMVPEANVQNAVALNTAMMTGSRIFGPALAGVLITTVGYGWAFLADGLSYIAVLAGLWMMRPAELRPAPPAIRGKGQVREGLRYTRATPDLWISLVMMAVIGTLAFNFSVTFPLFVTRALDGDEQLFTLLFSVVSIGSVAGSLWAARRESVELRQVVVAAFLFGAAMLLLAGSPGIALAFPFAVLVGLGSIIFMTSSTALLQLRADPSMRGRVLALQAMVFLGSTPVGGPIVGWVSEVFGARMGLVVGGVACIGAGIWGGLAGRRRLDRTVSTDGLVASGADANLQSA